MQDKWHNRRVKAVIEAEKLKLRCENNSSKTVVILHPIPEPFSYLQREKSQKNFHFAFYYSILFPFQNRLNETLLFCIGAVSLSVFFAIHLGLITIQDKVASVEINDDL